MANLAESAAHKASLARLRNIMSIDFKLTKLGRLAKMCEPVIPCVFTALSLILAGGQGVVGFIKGEETEYEPMLAVLTATLVAIIWYTYFTYESLQHARTREAEERRRARKSLASGLLAELQWLDDILWEIYQTGRFPSDEALRSLFLQEGISRSILFEPDTVGKLARFYGLLNDVRVEISKYQKDPEGVAPGKTKEVFKNFVQGKVGFVLQELPKLVAALEAEGGVKEMRVIQGGINIGKLPSVPESPYGQRRPREDLLSRL